jgi:hypothetical protein
LGNPVRAALLEKAEAPSDYPTGKPARLILERRQYSRRRDSDLGWIRSVRLKGAGEVALIDLSAGGALFDAAIPLRPGSTMWLELLGSGLETLVSVHVLRAEVSQLGSDRVRFRGACEFASPIELPDLGSLNHLPSGNIPDAFVGVDSALKRLVERAYSADESQRLASGDVLLVLQALARRAAIGGTDPVGQYVGNMLQDLLPGVRHQHGLPTVLAAIERQLSLALPAARVRLPEGAPTPAGVRSVIVSPPGAPVPVIPVSIDLPANAVLNQTQAQLLRTSSRVIALVQRLNLPMPSEKTIASETEAPA